MITIQKFLSSNISRQNLRLGNIICKIRFFQHEFSHEVKINKILHNSPPHTLDMLLGVRWDLAASSLSHRLVTNLTLRWEQFALLDNVNILLLLQSDSEA